MPALPDPSLTDRTIEIYLRLAYEGEPPPRVARVVGSLTGLEAPAYFDSDAFERDPAEEPRRWSLRLGNDRYPHMKLRIDRRPDAAGFLYDVDTHDMHIAPAPGSPEYDEFRELMSSNKRVAAAIESAWTDAGIPTFKNWLAEDLARRRSEGPS